MPQSTDSGLVGLGQTALTQQRGLQALPGERQKWPLSDDISTTLVREALPTSPISDPLNMYLPGL